MAIREIRTFQDPVLRRPCKPVEKVDAHIRALLGDMLQTLHATPNGGALAANQVGILRRLVVIDLGEGVMKLVNPEIVRTQGERQVEEGCLSFPGVWVQLRRPVRVVVKALNEQGRPVTIRAAGMLAKCLCHELDHLDGVLFLDKAVHVEGLQKRQPRPPEKQE